MLGAVWMLNFLLFAMCRKLVVALPFWIQSFVPLDHLGWFHKALGYIMTLAIAAHVVK